MAGADWKIPAEVWEQAGRAGQADLRNLVAGAFDVKDLHRYPQEGYYYYQHEPPDMLVAGKIRGDDIRSR